MVKDKSNSMADTESGDSESETSRASQAEWEKRLYTYDGMTIDLENFQPYYKRRIPRKPLKGSHPVEILTEDIFQEIIFQGPGAKKLKDKKLSLLNILSNVVLAWEKNKVVKYSRSNNSYSINKRYGMRHFTVEIIRLTDRLQAAGYVHIVDGYFDHETEKGKQSRMMPTRKLLDRLEAIKEVNPLAVKDPVIRMPSEESSESGDVRIIIEAPSYTEIDYLEPIQLKNSAKELINYTDTDSTRKMRKEMLDYNALIASAVIACPKDVALNDHSEEVYDNPYVATGDLQVDCSGCDVQERQLSADDTTSTLLRQPRPSEVTSIAEGLTADRGVIYLSAMTHTDAYRTGYTGSSGVITKRKSHKILVYKSLRAGLYRVFNEQSFKKGGRFYGAEYQLMNELQRSRILINGNPVEELDFSNLHIRMLYHNVGSELSGDAYLIGDDPALRNAYKKMSLIAINARDSNAAVSAFQLATVKDPALRMLLKAKGLKPRDLLENFKQHHRAIERFFNKGTGIDLQNTDSRIASFVIGYFVKKGIPCLCVHDSFLIEKAYRQELEGVMQEAYGYYMFNMRCQIKSGSKKTAVGLGL